MILLVKKVALVCWGSENVWVSQKGRVGKQQPLTTSCTITPLRLVENIMRSTLKSFFILVPLEGLL